MISTIILLIGCISIGVGVGWHFYNAPIIGGALGLLAAIIIWVFFRIFNREAFNGMADITIESMDIGLCDGCDGGGSGCGSSCGGGCGGGCGS